MTSIALREMLTSISCDCLRATTVIKIFKISQFSFFRNRQKITKLSLQPHPISMIATSYNPPHTSRKTNKAIKTFLCALERISSIGWFHIVRNEKAIPGDNCNDGSWRWRRRSHEKYSTPINCHNGYINILHQPHSISHSHFQSLPWQYITIYK